MGFVYVILSPIIILTRSTTTVRAIIIPLQKQNPEQQRERTVHVRLECIHGAYNRAILYTSLE